MNSYITKLNTICRQAISENPKAVADHYAGKKAAIKFIAGQCMRLSKGTLNPKHVNRVLARMI